MLVCPFLKETYLQPYKPWFSSTYSKNSATLFFYAFSQCTIVHAIINDDSIYR